MKKLQKLIAVSLLLMMTVLSTTKAFAQESKVLKVASHLPPMTDIVELAGENLPEGYTIELVQVSDNIQYNEAVMNDEALASFAQHMPFMEMFNQQHDGDLVSVQPIYNAIVGFYAPEYQSMDEIQDGAEIAIPSDPTNMSRALLILEDYDLIELDDAADIHPTLEDITENPRDFKFTEVDLVNLAAAYEDGVDLVFSYPTFIEPLELTTDDALFLEEDTENLFAQTLVVREGNKDSDEVKALVEAFTSQPVRDFVDELVAKGGYINAITANEEEESADVKDDAEGETDEVSEE